MTKSHLHRRRAARQTGYDEGLAAGEAERNNLKGKYQSIVALLDAARMRIQQIADHLDDEGDRVYLGSTNHRDWLREMLDHMDRWSFDAMLPKGDINKMEADPYAEIRTQRARADAAEAELDWRTRALDDAEAMTRRLRDASANLIASASDTYKKRNGHLASFEDDSGEKCWIVPFDAFEALRSALTAQVQEVAQAAATAEDADCCIACESPLVAGDLVYWDVSDTGYLHAGCCGPERESYVNEHGEPLKDGDPIPQPFPYEPDRAADYIYTGGEKE